MTLRTDETHVSLPSAQLLNLLLEGIGAHDATRARWSLPAGAVHLSERRLILAATPCQAPLFQSAMYRASEATCADVILAHHGLSPEVGEPVGFSVLLHEEGQNRLLEHMVLYQGPTGALWLVPEVFGPYIAIGRAGLKLELDPPFATSHAREHCVREAAAMIVRATRSPGAM